MLAKPLWKNGPVTLEFQVGDVEDTHDQDEIAENQTGGGTTLTGAKVAALNVRASGNAGAVATTLPTAAQIVDALRGAFGIDVPPANSPFDVAHNVAPDKEFPSNLGIFPPRASFRFTLINANGGTNTLTAQASSGVTISGTATVATNVWREWIVRILASAPTVIVQATTTNANPVLTNVALSELAKIQIGMTVTGTNIGAGAVVVAVNRDARTVTLSVNSTGTADNVAVTFQPTVTFTNLRAGTI